MIDWTVVSSVATSIAVLVVAWQAHETRKTAQETGKTADAAMGSLEIGREALRINHNVALEATKTRLDSRAPRLKVSAAPTSRERARHRPGVLHTGDLGSEWPSTTEFRRDEDDHQILTLGTQFKIENEGDVTVEVWIDGPVNWPGMPDPTVKFEPSRVTVTLAPGECCEFRLEESRPLHQWAEAWENRPESSQLAGVFGWIICSDSFDDGVIDRWKLEAWCYPVEPKSRDRAGWLVRPVGVGGPPDPLIVTARVGRQKREYFFSKEENKRIKLENIDEQ